MKHQGHGRSRLPVRLLAGAAAGVLLLAGCGGGDGDNVTSRAKPGQADAAGQAGQAPETSSVQPQPEAQPAGPLRAGESFRKIKMAQKYTPAAPNGGSDEYRCFLIDPGTAKATYITGAQFLPQQAKMVHHAILYAIDASTVAEAKAKDAATPGPGWTCFGGTGLGNGGPAAQLTSRWVGSWAPGGKENLAQPGTGQLLEAGTQIVLQVHYNLLALNQGEKVPADQSAVRFRVAAGNAPLIQLKTRLLPAPVELPCAPGEKGALCNRDASVFDVMRRFGNEAGSMVAGLQLLCNQGRPPTPGPTQHCDREVRQPGVIRAVAGHMHLRGRAVKVELNPGTPGARVLLDNLAYNFDDQGARPLPKPVAVKAGDTLRITCTHDATLRAKIPQLQKQPPRYVVWGDGSSDEMCLGVVIWSDR